MKLYHLLVDGYIYATLPSFTDAMLSAKSISCDFSSDQIVIKNVSTGVTCLPLTSHKYKVCAVIQGSPIFSEFKKLGDARAWYRKNDPETGWIQNMYTKRFLDV